MEKSILCDLAHVIIIVTCFLYCSDTTQLSNSNSVQVNKYPWGLALWVALRTQGLMYVLPSRQMQEIGRDSVPRGWQNEVSAS